MYKQSDFVKRIPEAEDLVEWNSKDLMYCITTSTHPGAHFFVYESGGIGWESLGIRENTFLGAIAKLNQHINDSR
jgi:hypothetical protein